MFRATLAALALVIVTPAPAEEPAAPPTDPAELLARVKRSDSPEEVRRLLGPPPRVARQVLYNRVVEQWVYDRPLRVRVEFDRPRGQPAEVRGVHPADRGKP